MSVMITLSDWLGPYDDHVDATDDVRAAAEAMLDAVNRCYAAYASTGASLPTNPATGNGVSGNGHGGFRPCDCSVGAAGSQHKTGHAVDRYDPDRAFARWCLRNLDMLAGLGLHMEDPRWTPSWVHLQDVPPKSGRLVFIPSSSLPLAAGLPEQAGGAA